MFAPTHILIIIKYIVAVAIVFGVWMLPAWLARQNGADGLKMAMVRMSSWVFGWTGVGWLLGLYWAVKK
ncbi:MAG: hypothetical protein FWC51_04625 [Proteobacteria bacterium]|nr:hypothetical protein [Pseudomonadota bacterium]